jgi:hypothetical protein
MKFYQIILISACFSVLIILAGCSQSGQPFRGTITYNGQPVPQGIILLTPKDNGALPTMAEISNGVFTIPAKYGILAGDYSITIKEPIPEVGGLEEKPQNMEVTPPPPRLGFISYTMNYTFPSGVKEHTLNIDIPLKTKK